MQSSPDKLKLFEHTNFNENHLISADSGTISVIQNKRWPSRLSLWRYFRLPEEVINNELLAKLTQTYSE